MGEAEQLTLRSFLTNFIDLEKIAVLGELLSNCKARERSHILCGLAVAVTNVDEVVATIRPFRCSRSSRKIC